MQLQFRVNPESTLLSSNSTVGMTMRLRARLLGCLLRDSIRIVQLPGMWLPDGGIPQELPLDSIPPGLWPANSEFTVLMDGPNVVGIERLSGERNT